MSIILQTFIASIAACCANIALFGCLLGISLKHKEPLAVKLGFGAGFVFLLIHFAIQLYQYIPFLH